MIRTIAARIRSRSPIALTLLALLLLLAPSSHVRVDTADADGQLDPTFGTGGWVRIGRTGPLTADAASAVAVQSDSKIVIVGKSLVGRVMSFGVTRLHVNGALDTTFGTNGWVTVSVPGSSDNRAHAVAIQKDGKIVVVGQTTTAADRHKFAIARLDGAGALDRTFGRGGWVTTDFGGDMDVAYAVALQDDAKIVAAGDTGNISGVRPRRVALVRYNVNGSLDRSFGGDGRVTGIDGGIEALCVQPDGRIVAVGESSGAGVVLRYRPDGRLDPTFGTGGVVSDQWSILPRAAVLQPDGRIVVAGGGVRGGFVLARYTPDGTKDATFGTARKDFGPDMRPVEATAVALQADGKIVAAGTVSLDPDFTRGACAVARYDATGVRDPSFGTNGKVIPELKSFKVMECDMALQSDGGIVAVGTMEDETPDGPMYDFVALRYRGASAKRPR